MGEHLVEIYLAERDEQRQEHADGKEYVEERSHGVTNGVKGGGEIAGQIAHRTHENGYRQRPVSQKSYKLLHDSLLIDAIASILLTLYSRLIAKFFTLHSSL